MNVDEAPQNQASQTQRRSKVMWVETSRAVILCDQRGKENHRGDHATLEQYRKEAYRKITRRKQKTQAHEMMSKRNKTKREHSTTRGLGVKLNNHPRRFRSIATQGT